MWIGAPASFAEPVVNDVAFASPARGLYVGATGNISVVMYGSNQTRIFSNVPVGLLPIQCTKVNASGTSASSLLALW